MEAEERPYTSWRVPDPGAGELGAQVPEEPVAVEVEVAVVEAGGVEDATGVVVVETVVDAVVVADPGRHCE